MRDIYVAIMVAASHGRGINLTAEEVSVLATDTAIETRAANGLDKNDWPNYTKFEQPPWEKINPNRPRRGENLATGD